jgi:hypothetical protein
VSGEGGITLTRSSRCYRATEPGESVRVAQKGKQHHDGRESYHSERQGEETCPLREAKRQGRRKASSGVRARMARKACQKRRLAAASSRAGASAGSLRPEVPFVQSNQEPSGLSENDVLASG